MTDETEPRPPHTAKVLEFFRRTKEQPQPMRLGEPTIVLPVQMVVELLHGWGDALHRSRQLGEWVLQSATGNEVSRDIRDMLERGVTRDREDGQHVAELLNLLTHS